MLHMIKHYNEIQLLLNHKFCTIHFQIISVLVLFSIFVPEFGPEVALLVAGSVSLFHHWLHHLK